MNLNVSGGGAANYTTAPIAAADVRGVEIVNIRAAQTEAADIVTINASTLSGLTKINSDRSTSVLTVTGLAQGQEAGMIGNDSVTNGDLNQGYAATATSSVTNIQNGTEAGAVTISGTGLSSGTVNSTGNVANVMGALTLAASQTSLTINAAAGLTTGAVTNTTAAALTTVTIAGAGLVDLDAAQFESTVVTVNASESTGGAAVHLSSAATSKFTGGSGNDTVTTGAVLTTGSASGGAGTDTLIVGANVSHVNTSSLAAKYTNFETLRVTGTLDTSLLSGITAIQIGGTSTLSNMSAAQAASVQVRADAGASSFALVDSSGTSDTLSLTMGTGASNDASEATDITGALTINGFETLNVKTNAGALAGTTALKTAEFASFTADSLTKINLTGHSVTLTNAATTKAVSIDGSALTGVLQVGGNLVEASTVLGGAGNDTYTLGTVNSVTYNGGAGDDTFQGAATVFLSGGVYNTVVGGAGTDTISITGGAALTMTDSHFAKVSGVEAVTVATTAANAISITTGGFFNTAFSSGATITTTTTTGNTTIDANLATTDLTISVTTVGTQAGEGVVTITTGDGNDNITVTAATAGDSPTVSGGAGNDVITGSVDADSINGGSGNDTITGGTGADTIIGGAGVDTMTASGAGVDVFRFSDVDTDVDTTAGAVTDIITDYVTTSDTLDFDTAGAAGNYSEVLTAASSLSALLSAADSALNGTIKYYFGVVGSDGYLVFDDDGTGYTSVIKLSGVTDIAAADIV